MAVVESFVDLWRSSEAMAQSACVRGVAVTAVLDRAGVREGQPFVLGADGSYDLQLNRFLRELPSWGVRAKNSIEAYARDLMLFCRFLHESRAEKSIWQALALAALLAPAAPDHPWRGRSFKTGWGAKTDLQVTLVAPDLVAEISADVARDQQGRWRHLVRYLRVRTEMHLMQVPGSENQTNRRLSKTATSSPSRRNKGERRPSGRFPDQFG